MNKDKELKKVPRFDIKIDVNVNDEPYYYRDINRHSGEYVLYSDVEELFIHTNPKHETVEQWEKRTGETYPDDGPVWIYKEFKHNANMPDNTGWGDDIWKYGDAKKGLAFYTVTKIIVANHHGKPPKENEDGN